MVGGQLLGVAARLYPALPECDNTQRQPKADAGPEQERSNTKAKGRKKERKKERKQTNQIGGIQLPSEPVEARQLCIEQAPVTLPVDSEPTFER